MAPFYQQAEELLGVCGTKDPLHPFGNSRLNAPPPLDPRDQTLFDSLKQLGLNPYRSHIGCKFVTNCLGCGGGLCPRNCRTGDAGQTCLIPALEKHNAQILPECEVLRIEADHNRVTGVRCKWQGAEIEIRGKVVILSAGAYMSPTLLLRSKSELWPKGLANSSDLVGRNLMLHSGDLIAVRPNKKLPDGGRPRSISFNDFYILDGNKLGAVQSMGLRINWRHALHYLRARSGSDPKWWLTALKPFFRPMSLIGGFYFRHAKVFATIVEDLPYLDNRIVLDEESVNGMRFEYNYPGELMARNELLRGELARRFGRKLKSVVLSSKNNLNYGHACGTCRFADDPKEGVLNRFNRAHDLDNLYVVDASFFPSSSGTNPGLTISANALRIAAVIDQQLQDLS